MTINKNKWAERDPNEMVNMYNYPWSGRLGRISDCCLYCGDDGSSFQISSSGTHCLGIACREARANGSQPIPELLEKSEKEAERLAKEWCAKNYVDYEATVKNFEEYLGPQQNAHQRYQELEAEGKTEVDYTVYLDKSEVRKIDEPFEPSKIDDILNLAEIMVAEKRAEGWTQTDFAKALKELLEE